MAENNKTSLRKIVSEQILKKDKIKSLESKKISILKEIKSIYEGSYTENQSKLNDILKIIDKETMFDTLWTWLSADNQTKFLRHVVIQFQIQDEDEIEESVVKEDEVEVEDWDTTEDGKSSLKNSIDKWVNDTSNVDWYKNHPLNTKNKEKELDEEKMTKSQKEKKEDIVLALKGKMKDFKEKYGSKAKDVMYATATKKAMGKK